MKMVVGVWLFIMTTTTAREDILECLTKLGVATNRLRHSCSPTQFDAQFAELMVTNLTMAELLIDGQPDRKSLHEYFMKLANGEPVE